MKHLLDAAEILVKRMESEIRIHQKDPEIANFSTFPGWANALECMLDTSWNFGPLEDRAAALYKRYETAHGYEYDLRHKRKR